MYDRVHLQTLGTLHHRHGFGAKMLAPLLQHRSGTSPSCSTRGEMPGGVDTVS